MPRPVRMGRAATTAGVELVMPGAGELGKPVGALVGAPVGPACGPAVGVGACRGCVARLAFLRCVTFV